MDNERSAIKMDNPRERYLHDAEFREVVDFMLNLILDCSLTPFELKQALTVALDIYQETFVIPHPIRMPVGRMLIEQLTRQALKEYIKNNEKESL